MKFLRTHCLFVFFMRIICFHFKVQDKSAEGPKPVRISKGIPQSFMVRAEPGTKGAMLTSTGEYAIPAIDAYVSAGDTHKYTLFMMCSQLHLLMLLLCFAFNKGIKFKKFISYYREAYAQGKKERPPFVPHDQSSSEDDSDPIPDELLCPICNDLMTDAVVIPCCGNSYCDDCEYCCHHLLSF